MSKNELKYRLLAGAALALIIGIGGRWVAMDQFPQTPETPVTNGVPVIHGVASTGRTPVLKTVGVSESQPTVSQTTVSQTTVNQSPDPSHEIRSGCFLAKFEHHRMRGHTTREECSRHQNEIVLAPDNGVLRAIQEKSPVCMKLNGTPLEFEKKGNRLVFANVAGPDSVVTIQYCLGKAKCTDPCAPKKDAFLSAVGADEDDAEAGNGKWDSADGDDGDLGTEFADILEAEKRQPRGALASSTEWSADSVTSGCSITSVSSR